MDIGLYVHIPFCEKKCNYCNFCSVAGDENLKSKYIDILINEANIRLYDKRFNTIFIGGGTPTCLADGEMTRLLYGLNVDKSNLKEFTVEANPNSLTDSKISEYLELGVTRISLGVQSLNDLTLAAIGRLHNSSCALERLDKLKYYPIEVNVDYMVGLPFQTIEDVKNDINALCKSGIKHLSCYSLILEENTPIFQLVKSGKIELPDDDAAVEMYDAAKKIMEKYGLKRYEISNFGKPCQHNLIYWRLNNYIGLGAAAHSFIDGIHSFNADNINNYNNFYLSPDNCKETVARAHNSNRLLEAHANATLYKHASRHAMFEEQSNEKDIIQEFIMLGFRLDKGVDLKTMAIRFGNKSVQQFKKTCNKYSQYLNFGEDSIAIKPYYTYVSSGITADIIFDAVK